MPPSQLTVPDNLTLTSNSTNLLTLKGHRDTAGRRDLRTVDRGRRRRLEREHPGTVDRRDQRRAAHPRRVRQRHDVEDRPSCRSNPRRDRLYNTTAGFWAGNNAFLYAQSGTAKNNATGYASWWNSLIVALSTNANNSGNTANYAPATSGTVGNIEALIQWS